MNAIYAHCDAALATGPASPRETRHSNWLLTTTILASSLAFLDGLVGKDTQMPDYVVLISTLGGIAIFRLDGLVIGPVIAAMFIAVWDIFSAARQSTRLTPPVGERSPPPVVKIPSSASMNRCQVRQCFQNRSTLSALPMAWRR